MDGTPSILFVCLNILIYNLSDVDLINRARVDMSFKYFLEMEPEDDVIDPSLLTHFRRRRLKDENLLDLLIGKRSGQLMNMILSKLNQLLSTRRIQKLDTTN
ncbi:hypothetical protein TMU01_10290 [Tenuibacillus multivorans]|nr:hypothetical protein TMU01_10290 [Tenuibacillus multivorans]